MNWDHDANFPAQPTLLPTYNDGTSTINTLGPDEVLASVTPLLLTGQVDNQSIQDFSLIPATSSAHPLFSYQCRPSDEEPASVLKSDSTCVMSAVQILQALHIPSIACSSSQNDVPLQGPRTIETILSTNALVGARLSEISSCSCSSTAPVQLLLALICRKLISWNGVVAHTPFAEAEALDTQPALARTSTDGRILHQPIMIGQHQIEGRLSQAIYAHIFHKEMPNLEGLVEGLSQRLLEGRDEDKAVTSTAAHASACEPSYGSTLSDSVRRDLAFFLKEHLEAIKMENTRFL